MVALELRGLTVEFPGGHRAVDNVDLHLPDGQAVVVAGPSGSGKTTLLRAVAGLETPTAGDVLFDGVSVVDVPVRERDVSFVGGADALYRHLDVEGNLDFPLAMREVDPEQRRTRVRATSRVMRLTRLLRRRPTSLSGGERQRAAFGRATGRRPRLFLFDEPLAEIEPAERNRLISDLREVQRGMGVTTIFVTHEQRELMTLGDRLAIMNRGRIEQIGPALDLYRRPANVAVASFVGDPPMALVRADLDLPQRQLRIAGLPVPLPREALAVLGGAPRTVLAGVRAEDLAVGGRGGARLPLHVAVVAPLGFAQLVTGDIGGRPASRVTARAGASTGVRVGDVVPVGVDPRRIHLFDAASGAALYPRSLH